MAKSQTVVIRGEGSWAKIFESNRDMYEWNEDTGKFDAPSSTDGSYTINVALEMDEYKKLKRSGSLAAKNSKENEVGLEVVKLRRPHVKRGKEGKVLDFASGAPKVVNDMGLPWNIERDGLIGNGSDVEITLVVYETAYSPGTRLEKVKVINNIPIETDKDGEDIPF